MKNPHAQALGRLGGSAKSKAKTKAARANAKKGGWPKGRKRKGETVYYLGRDNKASLKEFVKGAKLAEPFEG